MTLQCPPHVCMHSHPAPCTVGKASHPEGIPLGSPWAVSEHRGESRGRGKTTQRKHSKTLGCDLGIQPVLLRTTHQLLGVLGLEETFILTTALRKTKLSNKPRCTFIGAKWNFSTCIFFGEANTLGIKKLDAPLLRDASSQQVEHTLAAWTQVHGSC